MDIILKKASYLIISNVKIAKDVYRIELSGDTSGIIKPGQFVNIKIKGLYLRRPISVCDWNDKTMILIYKTVGEGTKKLSEMAKGEYLDILSGLGNGFDILNSGENPLIIGGGVGIPPLYALTKKLIKKGCPVNVILGFNSEEDIFYVEEFRKLGAVVTVTTVDGSFGKRGFVTDVMEEIDYSYIYTCGPMPMLRAVFLKAKSSGQFSFEERMGCGFGACMGCSHKTKDSYKRICREGPVLYKEEILWRI